MSPGQAATLLQKVRTARPLLTLDGKPAIVFVSEESCPFCAAERWALTVALSQFGSWSHLGITRSSATDIYPNTATLSFRAARYRSAELTLRTTELTDNVGRPLQSQTPLDARLIASYDVPPYVNSVDQSGAVPFLDIGNRFVLAGAQYDPQVLAGLSAAQIASQLGHPSSLVAQAIDGAAKVIVAAIDQVLHSDPSGGLRLPVKQPKPPGRPAGSAWGRGRSACSTGRAQLLAVSAAAASFCSTSSPSIVIWISSLTTSLPSSIMLKLSPKSFRLILVVAP